MENTRVVGLRMERPVGVSLVKALHFDLVRMGLGLGSGRARGLALAVGEPLSSDGELRGVGRVPGVVRRPLH